MKVVDDDIDATFKNFKKYVKTAKTSQKDAIMLLSCVLFNLVFLLLLILCLLFDPPQKL